MADLVRVKNLSKSKTLGFGPSNPTIAPGGEAVIDLDNEGAVDFQVGRKALRSYVLNSEAAVVADS